MAQINLLKQKSATENLSGIVPGALTITMVVVFLLTGAYYGSLYFKLKSISKDTVEVQNKINTTKKELAGIEGRDELLVRQSQLEELKKLVDKHKYWSQIVKILATATLKKAFYSSVLMTPDGNLTLTVTVPDLKSLDKFLLVFDRKEVYQNFNYVKIGGIRQVDSKDPAQSGVSVDVRLKFNSGLLNYQKPEEVKK